MAAELWVLWGWSSKWPNLAQPMRIMSGSLRDCQARQKQFSSDYADALCGIYATSDAPEGLRLQVAERMSS